MGWLTALVLNPFCLVGIGGAAGSCVRYAIGTALTKSAWAGQLPIATSLVNVVGSFLLGCIASGFQDRTQAAYLLAGVGFCGGLTTFSTFSLELVEQIQAGRFGFAMIECLTNVVLGMLALYLGFGLLKGN